MRYFLTIETDLKITKTCPIYLTNIQTRRPITIRCMDKIIKRLQLLPNKTTKKIPKLRNNKSK